MRGPTRQGILNLAAQSLGEYRQISCPPGFTLQRSDVSLTSDKCVECPMDSYSLVEAASTAVQCKPCPVGRELSV